MRTLCYQFRQMIFYCVEEDPGFVHAQICIYTKNAPTLNIMTTSSSQYSYCSSLFKVDLQLIASHFHCSLDPLGHGRFSDSRSIKTAQKNSMVYTHCLNLHERYALGHHSCPTCKLQWLNQDFPKGGDNPGGSSNYYFLKHLPKTA